VAFEPLAKCRHVEGVGAKAKASGVALTRRNRRRCVGTLEVHFHTLSGTSEPLINGFAFTHSKGVPGQSRLLARDANS